MHVHDPLRRLDNRQRTLQPNSQNLNDKEFIYGLLNVTGQLQDQFNNKKSRTATGIYIFMWFMCVFNNPYMYVKEGIKINVLCKQGSS